MLMKLKTDPEETVIEAAFSRAPENQKMYQQEARRGTRIGVCRPSSSKGER